jgi:hypothetical protein
MTTRDFSRSHRCAESHLGAVELAQFGVAEEDAMHVFIHLFEPGFFVAEYFADENPPLVPADISAVVHPPRLERSWILKGVRLFCV